MNASKTCWNSKGAGGLEQAQRFRLDRMSTWRASAAGPWNRSVSRIDSCRVRIEKAAFEKRRAAADWTPEYKPASIVSPNKTASAVADIYTVSSLAMITEVCPFHPIPLLPTLPTCPLCAALGHLSLRAGTSLPRWPAPPLCPPNAACPSPGCFDPAIMPMPQRLLAILRRLFSPQLMAQLPCSMWGGLLDIMSPCSANALCTIALLSHCFSGQRARLP